MAHLVSLDPRPTDTSGIAQPLDLQRTPSEAAPLGRRARTDFRRYIARGSLRNTIREHHSVYIKAFHGEGNGTIIVVAVDQLYRDAFLFKDALIGGDIQRAKSHPRVNTNT